MIIGVCGYGYTGSGAVYDYLKDRLECCCIDPEFNITYIPHGIEDLDYHLNYNISRYYSSDAAIKDFLHYVDYISSSPNSIYIRILGKEFRKLSEEYIESIAQLQWRGWWVYDIIRSDFVTRNIRFRILLRVQRLWERIFNKSCFSSEDDIMYFSVKPDCFLEATKSYIEKLLLGFGCDTKKIIVLNQPFEANAPQNSMKYFNNSKAIVVDKDPRDVYILAKEVIKSNASFIPTNKVETFIKYYRLCRETTVLENDDILKVSFEDMVYNTRKTISLINRFIGIPDLSYYSHKNFNPSQSINNTQLWLRFPKYKNDVKQIEKSLPEYLFNFDNYSIKPNSGLPFDK